MCQGVRDRARGGELDRGRELLWLHVGVAVLAVVTVPTLRIGVAGSIVVVAYELGLLAIALIRSDRDLLALWWFAASLSLWQLVPDQVLVEVVGSLRFPPDGVPDVGAVTLPMAGMWVVPTVLVVLAAERARVRSGEPVATLAAAGTALVVFAAAEAVLPGLGVWEPVGVPTIGSVAPYILVAEVLLGIVLWRAWRVARELPPVVVPLVTAHVSLAYTGAAVVSWLWLA